MQNIIIEILDEIPELEYKVECIDGEIIATKNETSDWKNHQIRYGKITINDSSYRFLMNFNVWSRDDYIQQWQEGLERLKQYDKSCLVENVSFVRGVSSIEWCVLYKINNAIHIQHHFVIGDAYDQMIGNKYFSPDTCYDFIPERKLYEDDGEKIKEIIIRKEC